MKKIKALAMLCTLCYLLPNQAAMSVDAANSVASSTIATTRDDVKAGGLIASYSLLIAADVQEVKITATTYGTDVMAKIGFVNIKVQRSSNGTSGWVTEQTPTDQTVSNSNYHDLYKFPVSVSGGYYYRVVLDHYAKETGWFFPSSQSVTNTSNVVWVPSS
ncbi:MAG: hypothetical protein IKG82_13835 [Oscillospiraceae bacterium]|nr:hypothetical protein [Oscillospiraceae bacterium]MBR3419764.1 hypothetical protein [Oscillospiraceae bacterium]